MEETRLRVHNFIPRSRANGPGIRSVLWVQGCTINCVGCINPATHPNLTRGLGIHTPAEILSWIPEDVVGLTLTGGEPFQQPAGCAELVDLARNRGLGIVCFSGYYHLELTQRFHIPGTVQLLNSVDMLIAGPWVRSMEVKNKPLISSSNQTIYHLTDRYENVNLETEVASMELHFNFDTGTNIKTGIGKG